MNPAVIRLLLLMLVIATAGCHPSRTSIFSSTPKASKEVLINNERYKRPYAVLGPVEYTLKKNTSFFTSQLDLREEAIESLKIEALARYGQTVDAIVDVQVMENSWQNNGDKLNVTHVKGIAIAFWPVTDKPYLRPKPRPKAPKYYPVRKPRPAPPPPPPVVAPRKSPPPQNKIIITPSEILK